MPIPNEDLVRRILQKNERGVHVRLSIEQAWDTFKEQHPDRAWWRRKATRRGLMWEYMVRNAIEVFDDDAGVEPIKHHDTVSFIFDQQVLLRFKKANIELRSANYPTSLASLFHWHQADLFGYEGLQRVEAAYVLSRFENDLDWVGIVARENHKSLWNFELDSGGAVIEQLPVRPTPALVADRVMRAKTEEDKKREEESE